MGRPGDCFMKVETGAAEEGDADIQLGDVPRA
jgi:hypothetical protein